jgi:NACalpha-BTF3-like transcription factor
MDSGIAAVLGALAGSVATIGAALATGWAQREGARIAARSEHRRERREPRHAVYRDLLEAATTFHGVIGHYEFFDAEVPEDLHLQEEDISGLLQKQVAVKKNAIEVALAGPKEVSEAAMKLAKWSDEIFLYATALTGLSEAEQAADQRTWRYTIKRATNASKQYGRALEEFVPSAQAALDDDGSRK